MTKSKSIYTMKTKVRRISIAIIMFAMCACTAKETPSTSSSVEIILSPSSLEIAPGEEKQVIYNFSRSLTNPQVVIMPVNGLIINAVPNAGKQSGIIRVSLAADVPAGTVFQPVVQVFDGSISAQKALSIKVKGEESIIPSTDTRQIRTAKYIDHQKGVFVLRYEYDRNGRVIRARMFDTIEEIVATYEYITESSMVCTLGDERSTFLISEGRIMSISYRNGDVKQSFEYDSYGRLQSWGDVQVEWNDGNIARVKYEKEGYSFTYELRYTSYPDKFGISFILGNGGIAPNTYENGFFPVISRVLGLNSANLPSRFTYRDTNDSSYEYNFDYTFDKDGYVKTIIDDTGRNELSFWYTDEPESSEETNTDLEE